MWLQVGYMILFHIFDYVYFIVIIFLSLVFNYPEIYEP